MGSFRGTRQSDEQLLAAHIAGDPYAFEILIERHRSHLSRVARVTSGDADDARDALQDAWLKAHCGAHRFRNDSSVSSWLHRIVVNACLDRRRRNRFHANSTELAEDVLPGADPTAGVDTSLVIERALLGLPVEQRAAVVAVDMQGYSVADAARLLGVPEGTVKSRCARARGKLARLLEHLSDDGPAAANSS